MNGSSITSSSQFMSGGSPVNPDPTWSVAGAGDFDGDGMSDLLWRNSVGQLALWTLNGNVITGSGFVTSAGNPVNPDPSWSIAGIGDLDGDGKSDLIWRNAATNEVAVWFMNGQTISGSGDMNAGGVAAKPDASWSLAGVGDFNADGSADLLWRKSDGTLAMWLMNGSSIGSSNFVTSGGVAVNPDASWHIVEIGDFNGDARSDILQRQRRDGRVADEGHDDHLVGNAVIGRQPGQPRSDLEHPSQADGFRLTSRSQTLLMREKSGGREFFAASPGELIGGF